MEDQVIVLDIDETLVHTFENIEDFYKLSPFTNKKYFSIRKRIYHMELYDVGEPLGSGDAWEMWGIEREGLIDFLKYCFKRFKYVIIWSAGQKRYVDRLSERLFRWSNEPHLILNWDNCRKADDMYDKPILLLKSQFPDIADSIRLENTFIIDDRQANFEQANINNGIPIPGYTPNPNQELLKPDNTLQKLIDWFELPSTKRSKDIRKLDKTKIWS